MTWEIYALGYLAIGAVTALLGDMGNRYLEGKNLPRGQFTILIFCWPLIIAMGLFGKIEHDETTRR